MAVASTTTVKTAAATKAVAVKPLPVTTIDDVVKMGEIIARTSMLGAKNPADGFIIASTCLQEGMSFKSFGATYHLIEGKLSMRADAMLARFKQSGGKYAIKQRDADGAILDMTSSDGTTYTSKCIWEEIKGEPFVLDKDRKVKKNYASPRSRMQMLWARAVSDGVRVLAPEVLDGCYTPEEVGDVSDELAKSRRDIEEEIDEISVLPKAPIEMPPLTDDCEISIPSSMSQMDVTPVVNDVQAEEAPEFELPPPVQNQREIPKLPNVPLPPRFTE